MLRSALLVTFANLAATSFCGDSAIPFSLEVLNDGQPVLGCARPSCFGWDPYGKPATHGANFYRINDHPDGFLRIAPESVPPFGHQDPRWHIKQTAVCEETFSSTSCHPEYQWAAGIAPMPNVSTYQTVLQCCTYEPLRKATDRGTATVKPGQIVVGGEVMNGDHLYAFDYISDISKQILADGSVYYEVGIRRFDCIDHTEKPLSKKERKEHIDAVAFQAPTLEGEALPLPTGEYKVEGPFAEDGYVEGAQQVPAPVQQTPPPPSSYVQQPLPQLPQQPVQPAMQQQVYQTAPLQPAPFQPMPLQPTPLQPAQQLMIDYVRPPKEDLYVKSPALLPYSSCCTPQLFPQQPVQYQPAQPFYPGYSSSYYCFSGDTMVRVPNGEKRMDALTVDDYVQVLDGAEIKFSKISFWLHRMPQKQAHFLKMTLDDGTTLKITGKHYIYKTDCPTNGLNELETKNFKKRAVLAEKVEVGDCLYKSMEESNKVLRMHKVENIEIVEETGIYAPMTPSGKILVNDVLASCHNIIYSNTLQQSFFMYVNKYLSSFLGASHERELPFGMESLLSIVEFIVPDKMFSI